MPMPILNTTLSRSHVAPALTPACSHPPTPYVHRPQQCNNHSPGDLNRPHYRVPFSDQTVDSIKVILLGISPCTIEQIAHAENPWTLEKWGLYLEFRFILFKEKFISKQLFMSITWEIQFICILKPSLLVSINILLCTI